MDTIIDHDNFEEARTPEAFKEILNDLGWSSFCLEDVDYLVSNICDSADTGDFIDDEFLTHETNGDVFASLEAAAGILIGAGQDLTRCLELWRGRHALGVNAKVVERWGYPKIGVMCVTEDSLIVQYDNVRRVENLSSRHPEKHARDLLRSLRPFNPFSR